MRPTVFYAWESDLDERTNRYFLRDAINGALRRLNKGSVDEPIRIDHDTKNEPGMADIADAILKKIDAASAFVGDVSIINGPSTDGRLTPNPNVLVELGYAAARLGWPRLIAVVNTATLPNDDVAELPFDVRGRRLVRFRLAPDASEETRREVRQGLEATLQGELHRVFRLGARAQLIDFLNDTNPEIMERVQRGDRTIQLLIAHSRTHLLDRLCSLPDFASYAKLIPNGNLAFDRTNRIGDSVTDRVDGARAGYDLVLLDPFFAVDGP